MFSKLLTTALAFVALANADGCDHDGSDFNKAICGGPGRRLQTFEERRRVFCAYGDYADGEDSDCDLDRRRVYFDDEDLGDTNNEANDTGRRL